MSLQGLFIMGYTMGGITIGVLLLKSPVILRYKKTNIMRPASVMIWAIYGVAVILVVQGLVFYTARQTLSTAPLSNRFFYVAVGIAEAFFFRFGLLQFQLRMSSKTAFSTMSMLVLNSLIFTLFHYTRISMFPPEIAPALATISVPLALISIFVSSIALGVMMIKARNIAPVALCHGIFNGGVAI